MSALFKHHHTHMADIVTDIDESERYSDIILWGVRGSLQARWAQLPRRSGYDKYSMCAQIRPVGGEYDSFVSFDEDSDVKEERVLAEVA